MSYNNKSSVHTSHYLWELRPYFRQVAGELLLGSICGILMNTMVVLPAIMLGRAIDVLLAFDKGQASLQDVAWAALAFFGGMLATQIPRLGKRWWLMTANARIAANIRADTLRGVLDWSMARLHSTPIGDLMSRIVGDVEVLSVGIREFIIETWDTLLFSLSLVVAMFYYAPRLSVLALLPTPIAMLLAQAVGRWVRSRTITAREANATLTNTLQEQLAGVRVLKLFGRTESATDQVDVQSQYLADSNVAVVRLREGLKPVYSTIMVAGVVLVIGIGGQQVIQGAMTVGAFVAYMELFRRFTNRAYRIPQMFNSIQAGGGAYSRLTPLLAPPLSVEGEPRYASFLPGRVIGLDQQPPQPPQLQERPLSVQLRSVVFRYPNATQPSLENISLEIPAGSFVAVTGPVGCGKSALLRAILGTYPLEDGQILLDGRVLLEIPADERAARIGYLPQDPYLFSGSISENIAFGESEPAVAERILYAAHVSALEPDLQALPKGIETQIGELGVRVSGGQRQRIALARSLASSTISPGLLLLDDPFSAVDLDTEAQLIASLRQNFGPAAPIHRQATVLLSSHRLAAFPLADNILVLDQGKIVETGSHEALIARGGLYARIYQAQARAAKINRNGDAV
ncbi:MAG: ABC transporter ATP-binding protein [Bacteroidota bacterium]